MAAHLTHARPLTRAERCQALAQSPLALALPAALAAGLAVGTAPSLTLVLANLTYLAVVFGALYACVRTFLGDAATQLRGSFLTLDVLVLAALAFGMPTSSLNLVVLLGAGVAAALAFGTQNPRDYAFGTPALLVAAALVGAT